MTTTIEAARVEQLEAELRRTRTELAQANLQIGMLVRAAADNFDGAVRTVEWGVRLAGNPASLIEVGGGLLEAVQVAQDERLWSSGSKREIVCRTVQRGSWRTQPLDGGDKQ